MKPGGGPLVGYLLVAGRQVTVAVIRRGAHEQEQLRTALAQRPPRGPLWILAATPQELPAATEACGAAGCLARSAFTIDANLWYAGSPIADAWWVVDGDKGLQPAQLTALAASPTAAAAGVTQEVT